MLDPFYHTVSAHLDTEFSHAYDGAGLLALLATFLRFTTISIDNSNTSLLLLNIVVSLLWLAGGHFRVGRVLNTDKLFYTVNYGSINGVIQIYLVTIEVKCLSRSFFASFKRQAAASSSCSIVSLTIFLCVFYKCK